MAKRRRWRSARSNEWDLAEKNLTLDFDQTYNSNRNDSPFWLRAGPFLVFAALTTCQGVWGESSRYWVYALKSAVGLGLVFWMRPRVSEMRWAWSWEAVGAGVLVFAVWVGLDGYYPSTSKAMGGIGDFFNHLFGRESSAHPSTEPLPWNPHAVFGRGTALAWFFVGVRWVGSTWVVPPLEEVFYRSLLYRSLVAPDFQRVPFGLLRLGPLLLTSAIFGFTHFEWLPGILCGIVYQLLVIRKGRLGDAMTAHAITNGLLAGWVVWKGAWHFW